MTDARANYIKAMQGNVFAERQSLPRHHDPHQFRETFEFVANTNDCFTCINAMQKYNRIRL
jgi:hypothetical protein